MLLKKPEEFYIEANMTKNEKNNTSSNTDGNTTDTWGQTAFHVACGE